MPQPPETQQLRVARILERRDLSPAAFEVRVERPPGFSFRPGQYVRLRLQGVERDYTPVSAPADGFVSFCVRRVPGTAGVAHFLETAAAGTEIVFSGPHGYFLFRESDRDAVFVATGTGVAPFVSMTRAGQGARWILQGVRSRDDVLYPEVLGRGSATLVPCVSSLAPGWNEERTVFGGRVTDCLPELLPGGAAFDFYLCGRSGMLRDLTLVVDERHPGSRVYTETFFSDPE